ncbi:MAG: efflux RND transporter periplasmic adaptor subunit [Ignavibacteria bacterium]|nr:efflux RND transporter periplasmic adaptor subunit [Ignavibacteria bacterium]
MKSVIRIPTPILILLMGIFLSSCKKPANESNGQKIQPVNVRLEIVKPARLVDAIQVAGTVKAYEDVNLSPEEGGVVKEWKVKKGQRVKKGDLVVVLKDEVIRASYEAAQAQYNMAELNLAKQREVFDQQGISELQYRNLEYTRDAAKANLELMKARWERTQLRSPFDGTVDNTMPNEGELAAPGMPIARIVNISVIKIQAEVPELYSGTVPVGTQAVITFDALPGDTLRGKVSFVGSTVSAANRTLMVEIILPNPYRKLKPEMVAKVKLMRKSKANAILVSENVIQLVDRDRTIVYVEKGGVAEERRLKLGARQGNMVEVLEGLNPGDHLIVGGYQKLANATPVFVTQEMEKRP